MLAVPTTVAQDNRPSFIVFQPDDLQFFEEWKPAAHFSGRNQAIPLPETGLPNIERLMKQGLHMKQAYTASPKCGTSRYSSMTGRYPSRSSYGRDSQFSQDVASVGIPTTKLEDLDTVIDGNDCSEQNLAQVFKENNYRTGMVGKWHLHRGSGTYSYEDSQERIRNCGFDYAESVYIENQGGDWHDGTFNHNMEYMTAMAIDFINNSTDPFFLYFNPTAPHGSGNVHEALLNFSCTDTPAGPIEDEPYIVGMTHNQTCSDYRASVIARADDTSNLDLGSIWVDDAIGAVLTALGDKLNNTFFLFQMDHGQEGKNSLLEPGTRIAQFIHFPNEFNVTTGAEFDGIVSTVDIGPTMLDYAGIDTNDVYKMDGKSWREAVENPDTVGAEWRSDRCLFYEIGKDRAVRCGCHKYMHFFDPENSETKKEAQKNNLIPSDSDTPGPAANYLFNICDESGISVASPSDNPEYYEGDLKSHDSLLLNEMQMMIECHLSKTEPDQDPHYYECDEMFSNRPTGTPTGAPSAAPTICENSNELFEDGRGILRNCTDPWIVERDSRCKQFGSICPLACGWCGTQ